METQNQDSTAKKVTKSYYKTLDEQIVAMQLTFSNATLPDIYAKMLTVGYTEERINDMKAKLDVLETKRIELKKETADSVVAQDAYKHKKDEVHTNYINHIKLVRILFAGNVHARTLLRLEGATPITFSKWNDVLKNFYRQLGGNAELQTQAATIGITAQIVNAQLEALATVDVLRETAHKESAGVSAAYDARDQAYDVVHPLYAEYVKYAKIVLDDNQLKALGV